MTSGNWFIQLRLGGESICITEPTKAEARVKAQLIKSQYLAGRRDAKNKKLGERTLAETITQYIESCRATLSPSTIRAYEAYQKARFLDYQDQKIGEIIWQDMIDDELQQFTPKTVRNGWSLVHASLKHVGYPIPTVRLAKAPTNEIPFLQPEEIKPFCAAIKGRNYEIALLLELHGLRLSEVLGLDWSRVDLKKKTITIRGATVRGPDGMVSKNTNKNETSARTVPIMIKQLETALTAVEDKTGAVVTQHPSVLLEDVKRACGMAGVTVVSNHGLRHSFASLCYHLGISERQLMQWGGWADYQTMHKIYVRLAASDQTKAQATVSAFFDEEK